MKKFEDLTSLTFCDNSAPDKGVDTTFQDDETLLVNININFKQKFTVKEFRKRITQLIEKEDCYQIMLDESDNKLDKAVMFYIMFENLIEYMLQDCDEAFIKNVKESMIFTEYTEIINTLSEQKFDLDDDEIESIEVQKVPANYSMSLCSCCKGKDETNDIEDFSKDDSPKT